MKLDLVWERPIRLKRRRKRTLDYSIDLDKVPNEPGIYVFGRRFKGSFEALYVGKANKIRGRVKGQLNNLKLMRHVHDAKAGKRFLLVARFKAKPRQQSQKCLPLAERALIRHFLSEGDKIVNKQGTRIRRHEIKSTGKHPKRYFPRLIYLER